MQPTGLSAYTVTSVRRGGLHPPAGSPWESPYAGKLVRAEGLPEEAQSDSGGPARPEEK